MNTTLIRQLIALFVVLLSLAAPRAFATINFVYHERTGNDATGGNPNTCGGSQVYVPILNPTSAQSYLLRFKVEYQFSSDTLRVYYTTDGSAPSGAAGVGSGTTLVVNGNYQCTYTFGSDTIDICNATIPAQPGGTLVKYIISAQNGGGPEIFANSGEPFTPFTTSAQATVFQYAVPSTTDLFWDSNGATAGAGATPTGTWGTSTFWSSLLDGTSATGAWVTGRRAVFSAGSDASGAFTVTLSGTQTASGMTVEEGTVTLVGGAVALAAGNITLNSGTVLSSDSSLRITATAGATINVNGGTLRTINTGPAGTFIDTDFAITLGAGGGTFSHVTANILNIVQTASVVTGSGGLTKTGAGVLAFANANTYNGPTTVTEGELRIRTDPDRLPVTTAVTVTAPGILNLNSVNQTIGSLSGNGSVGLGAATLTVGDSTSTVFSGVIANITNAGAAGVTTGAGRISKKGSGTLTLSGLNTYTGSLTNTAGTITVSPGAALCGAAADLVVDAGVLNLNNTAQTVLSLSGSGGTINLGSGHTLSINGTTSRSYSGILAGDGSLTKLNTGTLTLSGNNTYEGSTTVSGGRLSVQSATALGDDATGTTVASGAEVLFTGASTAFTISEPFTLSGPGGSDNGAIAVINSANVTISGPITLNGDTTNTVAGTSTVVYNNANSITGSGFTLGLQGGAGVGGGGTISGIISLGTGGINKLQGGTWKLSGNNAYDGLTTINAGTLAVGHNSALGSTVGGTVVPAGAISVDGSGLSIAEPITSLVGSGISSSGALRNLANNNTWTGPITLGGAAEISSDAGTFTLEGGINIGASTLTIDGAGTTRINVNGISGSGGLAKIGNGTLILSVPSTYDGSTTVAGTLVANNTTGSATSSGSVNVSVLGTLTGFGTIAGPVTVNGTIKPGASPGTLNTGAETWAVSGNYVWEINDATGTSGADPGYDLLNINGALNITATAAQPFTINITSLTPANAPGDAANFNNASEYTWVIATASGGITGFDPAVFNVVSTNFSNTLAPGGTFIVTTNGNNLELKYGAAPQIASEPVNANAECGFENATFTISATGSGTLAYQWKHAGTNLPGATSSTLSFTPPTSVDAGNYQVTVSNSFGFTNSAVVTLTLTDTNPPVVTCATNQMVVCGDVWDFTPPTVTDACGYNLTIVSTETNLGCGYSFTATRVWKIEDFGLSTSWCTQVVSLVDAIAPSITCPPDTNVQCLAEVPAPNVLDVIASHTESCEVGSPIVAYLGDVTNGTSPLIITRTYAASDACNNTNTCTQTITVQDTINPIAVCTNISVTLVAGVATITPADVNGGSSDNCALNLVSVEPNTFYASNAGPNNVTLTVSDNAEHTNTCVAVVTVIDFVFNTNNYTVRVPDLAPGKPQFSPPHGTGTNPFGYDWDSAAPDVADGSPAGYGCASFAGNVLQAGATQPDRYRTFRIGMRTLFGHNVSISNVANISYQTRKATPQTEVDWRLTIYTTREDLNPGNNGSFYRSRLQSTPFLALNLNAPANQWNTWTTATNNNQFQFKDNRGDFGTENMLWSEVIAGPVTRGTTTWDWTPEEVMMIDITLGANTGGGDAISQLDAVQIQLTDGTVANINLEALASGPVFVDDSYTGLPDGTSVTFPHLAGGATHTIGCDAFATIQGGITVASNLGTINVAPGTYLEDVAVNKSVSLIGAGAGQSIVSGPTNGGTATFQVLAAGVLIEGFTITREGNNPADWNGPLNLAGVAIQSVTASATVRNCWFEGNRSAIDINQSANNVIANNVLTNNRTGIIFRNDCQNNTLTNNAIVDNWTVGVLYLDLGVTALSQGTVLHGNNISGNWYGQIVDRRITPGTFDTWNCSGNWLGASALVITSANSAEPGYAGLIPVAFGGTEVPPGGAPNLAGPGVANIDYTPWLNVGTDTSAAPGFQGDFSTLHVDDDSAQAGAIGRIQEGVNSVSGSTVLIAAGAYSENIVISSKVTLDGAGSGTGAGDTIITAANASLPVILIDDAGGTGTGDRLTLKDLRVQGGADGIRLRATTAARAFFGFDNVASVQNANGAGLIAEGPQNVSDIDVLNSVLSNNNFGLVLATSIPVFNGLTVTGGEIKNNTTLGLSINPNGTDATDAATDYSNITVDGTAFENNGNAIFTGSSHLSFFRFNGNATIKNVTLAGPTWSPIQFRGEGVDSNPVTWQASGTVLLQNVTIGGSGIRPGLYIQDYSGVTGFTFDNVNLSTYLPPDVAGPNGFFAQAMQVRHTGVGNMNLGKITLPSTVAFSGFTPVSGFYALALTAPGGAQATCDTVIVGATTTQALEDAVFDSDDSALMAFLSLPPGSIGNVSFPALTVSCPANVLMTCSAPTGAVVTFPAATASGDCTPGTTSCTPPSGSVFSLGTTTVTCSVTDARGITATCTFDVTVVGDTNAPNLVCPPSITVPCDIVSIDPTNTGIASVTDNCSTNPTVSYVDAMPVEVTATNVSWALSTTDGGTPPNTATAEFVNGPGVPPLGSGSLRLAVGTNGNAAAQSRTTNYNGQLLSELTELRYQTYRTVDGSGGQGVYIILNIDQDGNGSSDDLIFFEPEYQNGYNGALPVQGPLQTGVWQSWNALVGGWWSTSGGGGLNPGAGVKTIATYLAAFPNARLADIPAGAVRLVAGFGAGAWDDFDGNADAFAIGFNGTTTTYDFELNAGNACGNTVVTRTWTATDDNNNSASCTQLIQIVDTNAPSITCSTNISVVAAPGVCGATVSFSVTATDNCDAAPSVVSTPASGSFFPVGSTTVTNVATDGCGNSISCTFTVTVTDTQAPSLTCPTNVTVAANLNTCAATNVNLGTPTAGDNCALATVTNDAPLVFLGGMTPVIWTAVDVHGNSSTCTQIVNVVDLQAPVINCSTNRLVEATGVGTPVFFETISSDNCGSLTTFCSKSSGDLFALGTTTVNCAAYDFNFNAAACNFDVTVVDTTPPVLTCSSNILIGCNRTNGAVVNFTVGVFDLADTNVTLISTPASGSLFPAGTTTVTNIAFDDSGNTNSCTFTVTVVEAPILLSIQRVGTNMFLRWPVTCATYLLDQTTNPTDTNSWVPNGSPVTVDSNFQNTVVTPHGGTNRFFRLRAP